MMSRTLRGVWLFLFSSVCASATFSAEPTTIEGRVNRNAYPLVRHASKYGSLPKAVESELRARAERVLDVVRLAPSAWFRASLGISPEGTDRRKILESVRETEIWKCIGPSCEGCLGNDGAGCVLGRAVGGGIGVVALIHPCLYGEGTCPRGSSTDIGKWTEKFVLEIAYYKAGLSKNFTALRKANQASGEWIRSTAGSVNRLLSACPGPYVADSMKFLFNLGAVTLPNPAILRCGQRYLERLRVLGGRCAGLSTEAKAEWSSFEARFLRLSADILRCDGYCMKMLCRSREADSVFTLFSGKPALLLGEGACDGENPRAPGRFTHEALPRILRRRFEEKGCLPPVEGGVPTKDSPEVQLVE